MTQAGEVALEPEFGSSVKAGLAARGHVIIEAPYQLFGGAQAIYKLPSGGYCAGSDPRKDGQAVGT